MKVYKASRKGFINYLLIGLLIFPVIIFFLDPDTLLRNPLILLAILSPLFLVSWIYFDTSYKIEHNILIYRSGFLRGKIEIPSIKEIIKGKTMWGGVKPALAKNGLVIKYNRYDEIYIAPQDKENLISHLVAINPEIIIVTISPE